MRYTQSLLSRHKVALMQVLLLRLQEIGLIVRFKHVLKNIRSVELNRSSLENLQ